MTGSELRHALVDAGMAVLPADWTGYIGPPEVVAFPALVLVPATPWLEPATLCDGVYRAGVSLLLPRSQGPAALDVLDEHAEPVRKALTALRGVQWNGTDLGPMIAPGGVEAYGATINVQAFA